MLVIKQEFITRKDIKNNPDCLYLFGDNLMRVGLGGQAREMRGEANSFGIATKVSPGMEESDFFEDSSKCREVIMTEFHYLHEHLKQNKYKAIVIPTSGLGTGLAELQTRAPQLLRMIDTYIQLLTVV